MKCRACLQSSTHNSTDFPMTDFIDEYILYFNLLTNLKIQLSDVKEYKICEFCLEMLTKFIEFRNKCILSHSVIQCSYELEDKIKKEDIKEESIYDDVTFEDTKLEEESIYDDVTFEDTKLEEESIYDDVTFEDTKLEPYEGQKILSHDSLIDSFGNNDKFACELVLENQNFQEREKVKSKNITGFPCGLCDNIFDDMNLLSMHLDTHKSNRSCIKCSDTFIDWQQVLSHRIMHVPWKKKLCHICFKRFQSSLYLEYHYKKEHSNEEKFSLRCPQCNKSYVTPRQLIKHIWACHSMKQFVCDLCSKQFTNKPQIKIHMAGHMDYKPYACDQCKYSSKFPDGLKNHKLRKHTPKSIKCNKCYRVFRNKQVHDSHKCSAKLTICSVCGKEFQGAKKLSSHMVSHESVCKYRCERCPAQYKTRDALRAHRDRHDGVRSKRCEYCPMTFYTTSVLIRHRRTHTGIKPYVCKICQKAFTGNHNLKVHMRVHGEYLITKKNQNDESV